MSPASIIPYNKSLVVGTEAKYVQDVINSGSLSGNGQYTQQCRKYLNDSTPSGRVFLTTSGTSALEFAAILADIQPGDEVIVPSYTYVSTANAMLLRGCSLVYVDVAPETMNIDASLIEAAITSKTRAIVPVHYSSVACDMNKIMDIAQRHQLLVIEDAASCLLASYENKALGSIGHIGCFSFHETKNLTSGGQGGAIMVNDEKLFVRAEQVFDCGTNRSAFLRGEVDHYAWRGLGSNFLMSETAAACLWAQLEIAQGITAQRRLLWGNYYHGLSFLQDQGHIVLPVVPDGAVHNGHIFWIKLKNKQKRDEFLKFMKTQGAVAQFHFVPLHSTRFGMKTGRFHGRDEYTTYESSRLARLPLWFGLTDLEQNSILDSARLYFNQSSGPNRVEA